MKRHAIYLWSFKQWQWDFQAQVHITRHRSFDSDVKGDVFSGIFNLLTNFLQWKRGLKFSSLLPLRDETSLQRKEKQHPITPYWKQVCYTASPCSTLRKHCLFYLYRFHKASAQLMADEMIWACAVFNAIALQSSLVHFYEEFKLKTPHFITKEHTIMLKIFYFVVMMYGSPRLWITVSQLIENWNDESSNGEIIWEFNQKGKYLFCFKCPVWTRRDLLWPDSNTPVTARQQDHLSLLWLCPCKSIRKVECFAVN